MATTIYIDADGCPVKDETYKVARRYQLAVRVVANRYTPVPASPHIEAIVVGKGFDEADDWIVEHAGVGDIVITADIPLAARCLHEGARVLGPKGRAFTEDSIGNAVASRELSQHLREVPAAEVPPEGALDVARVAEACMMWGPATVLTSSWTCARPPPLASRDQPQCSAE